MKAKTLVQLQHAKFGDGIAMGLPQRYLQCVVLVSLEFGSLQYLNERLLGTASGIIESMSHEGF